MTDGEQTGQVGDEPAIDSSEDQERIWTDFGYGFACFFFAFLVFFAPWYFLGDPFPKIIIPLIFSIVVYVAGLIVSLFGIAFFTNGVQKTPELRQLFPSLSTGEDAWQGAFGAMLFVVIVVVLQLLLRGFNMTGIAAGGVKFFTYIFAVLGITQIAQAIDGFVIRPLIATAARGPQEFEPVIRRVRQIGVAIGFIVALIAGIATIIDVF